MPVLLRCAVACVLITTSICASGSPALVEAKLAQSLIRAAHKANPEVIRLAVEAAGCAMKNGEPAAQHLAVIDYSLPSTQPRLWVFDLARGKLIFEELVAHGRNSGDNYARAFSNQQDSLASSLGLFRTLGSYQGSNGYSLRMSGLEPGINDQAEARAIVMHGAPYVNGHFLKTTGRLGRSHGCPAVRPEIAQAMIDTMKDGQYVFAYYPDRKWLRSSQYLGCTSQPMTTARSSSANLQASIAR